MNWLDQSSDETKEIFENDLSPIIRSTRKIYDDSYLHRKSSIKLGTSIYPLKAIDNFIINALSDHDLTQKYGDPEDLYSDTYSDLETLKETILTDIKIDINKNIKAQKDIIPKYLKKSIKKLLPARTSINDIDATIKPIIVDRSKVKYHKPSIIYDDNSIGIFERHLP